MPGFANRWGDYAWGGGRGVGYGRGGYGRGWRNRFLATGVPGWAWGGGAGFAPAQAFNTPGQSGELTRRNLEDQAEYLKSELNEINRRLAQLKGEKEA